MESSKGLAWFAFCIALIGLGLLVIYGAVEAAMLPAWPASYNESLASRLTADYSVDPDTMPALPPVGPGLVFDIIEEEAENGTAAPLPPGPLSTLEALASATPTFTPSPTPLPTNTPTNMPTPTTTPTPTRTPYPTLIPTPIITATSTPSIAITTPPEWPTSPPVPPTSPPVQPTTPPVSPLATPSSQ